VEKVYVVNKISAKLNVQVDQASKSQNAVLAFIDTRLSLCLNKLFEVLPKQSLKLDIENSDNNR